MAEGRGCLKVGCLGCVGVILALFVVSAVLLTAAWVMGRPEQRIERPELTREIPRESAAGPPGASSSDDFPPIEVRTETRAGRVELDLSEGSFEILAGEPGTPIAVEGRYDSGSYVLEQEYQPGDAEQGWRYAITFGRKVSWLRNLFSTDDNENRIRITLPPDVPLRLVGVVGVGQSRLELGGMRLREVDLDVGIGEHYLGFDAPNAEAMERLALRASMGELRVDELGNASPREVSVRHRIGSVKVDLAGAWQQDAEVEVRCGMGECVVQVPDQARLDLEAGDVSIGEASTAVLDRMPELAADAPVVRLRASLRVGELTVAR